MSKSDHSRRHHPLQENQRRTQLAEKSRSRPLDFHRFTATGPWLALPMRPLVLRTFILSSPPLRLGLSRRLLVLLTLIAPIPLADRGVLGLLPVFSDTVLSFKFSCSCASSSQIAFVSSIWK